MKPSITIYPTQDFKENIKKVAKKNNRSVNNLVLTIIKSRLSYKKPTQEDTTKKEVEQNNGTGQFIGDSGDAINGITPRDSEHEPRLSEPTTTEHPTGY